MVCGVFIKLSIDLLSWIDSVNAGIERTLEKALKLLLSGLRTAESLGIQGCI